MLTGFTTLLALICVALLRLRLAMRPNRIDQSRKPHVATATESLYRAPREAAPNQPGQPSSPGRAVPPLQLARRRGRRASGILPSLAPQHLGSSCCWRGVANRLILGAKRASLERCKAAHGDAVRPGTPRHTGPAREESRSCLARGRESISDQASGMPENAKNASIASKRRISIPINTCGA